MDQNETTDHGYSRTLRYGLLAIALAGTLGGLILFATVPDPAALPPAVGQAPLLRALRVESHPIASRSRISGLLEPRRHVDLFAEEGGRVIEVGADELDRIEAGQLLLRMDPLLAEVAIQRALAAMERAESQSLLAQANLKRNQGLADVDVASRSALDASEDAARQAKAAGVEAEASLAEARDRLAKKTVRAPFAGVLRTFAVETGEYVRPGERVAELLDVSQVEVTIGLTDNQVVDVILGAPVEVQVPARPGDRKSV
ncbi:MAG: efflux RND transporter periplasmic adaptor subunit, partial [Myxococcota bacterium]